MTNEQKDMRVLVVEEVEDDAVVRKVLHDKLSLEGFGVLEAKNGEEGLAIALENHPDLILLDILMPKMDGLTMLKKLREDEWGKTANVIILTNYDETEKIADALGSRVFEYYVKSDTPIEDLIAKVKEKLGA
jgi:CheY-like chemotaxis protein